MIILDLKYTHNGILHIIFQLPKPLIPKSFLAIVVGNPERHEIGLMHDDVLLINFTTKPRIQNANVSQRIEIEKNTSMKCGKSVQKLHGSEAWW